MRVDREAVRQRLAGDCEPWVIDALLDAFEPAAVAAIHRNSKTADKASDRAGEG